MVSFFRRKKPLKLTINLNMKLKLDDWHRALKIPFESFLLKKKIGKLTGGGIHFEADCSVSGCDFHLELSDKVYLAAILDELNVLGAAKGSSMQIDETISPFGKNEGLALFFDVAVLEEALRKNEIKKLYQNIENEILGLGFWLSTHMFENQSEFALYIYGYTFAQMERRLKALIDKEPLMANVRIEQIA